MCGHGMMMAKNMSRNCLDLTGRVAVMFGGSSGLGRAISAGLAEHGADVVPTARRVELLRDVCADIEALGRRTLVQSCDVQNRGSVRDLRERVLGELGRIDILVNAAGVTFRKPTLDVDSSEWDTLFDINLKGLLHTCQEFHPALEASGAGRIIAIASLGSYLAFQEVAAYCASKAAVLSLVRNLACEWARDRICVNAIAPGVFPTELNAHLLHGTDRGREILLRTPMHRFGNPSELVGAAVLLASEGASFITGQCIAVDGGYLASGVNS
jgi:NAD(P)-dependent dehydrogenase (short-subunit alcohol dehydrogenase family)